MANNNEVVVCEGKIADVAGALRAPLEHEVSHGLLGWTLAWGGSGFATLIRKEEALAIIAAQEKEHEIDREMAEQAEREASYENPVE